MITMYTGTPGSGKSLHVARDIFFSLTHKRNVIANFDVNLSVFKKSIAHFDYVDNLHLSPQYFYNYAFNRHRRNTNGNIVEGQTLIVIDECQILFNSRDWNAKNRMEWCTFFTQHRKYGYNIILITQFDRLVDRQIRSLVEYEVIHRNIGNFKTIGFFVSLIFGGSMFIAIKKWYCLHEKISSEMFFFRRKYGRLYDSYKIFSSAGSTRKGKQRGPAEVVSDEEKINEDNKNAVTS